MANYTIYFSPTGGTKKVADALVAHLKGVYQEIDLCKEGAHAAFQKEDVCLVSVPSYGGRVPAIAIERLQMLSGNGAKAILNCVYGNREWEDTLTELQDTLEGQGFCCVAAIAAVAEHSIFRQFAAGRPDLDDQKQLAAFAEQIQNVLDKAAFGKLELAGSHGTYKEYHGVPLQPVASADCTGCGHCAAECPVQAISSEDPHVTNPETCISCMRCIAVCPKQARGCDAAFLNGMAEKMAPVLSGHKENHLFLS